MNGTLTDPCKWTDRSCGRRSIGEVSRNHSFLKHYRFTWFQKLNCQMARFYGLGARSALCLFSNLFCNCKLCGRQEVIGRWWHQHAIIQLVSPLRRHEVDSLMPLSLMATTCRAPGGTDRSTEFSRESTWEVNLESGGQPRAIDLLESSMPFWIVIPRLRQSHYPVSPSHHNR